MKVNLHFLIGLIFVSQVSAQAPSTRTSSNSPSEGDKDLNSFYSGQPSLEGEPISFSRYSDLAKYYNAYIESVESIQKVSESGVIPSRNYLSEDRVPDNIAIFGVENRFEGRQANRFAGIQDKKSVVRAALNPESYKNRGAAKIHTLGKEINSAFREYAPTLIGDTLFYASDRTFRKGLLRRSSEQKGRVMIASGGDAGREPGRGFPEADTAHIAHTAFSPDGHYVIFTACDNVDEKNEGENCELWLAVIDRRNRWLPPVRLPEPINLKGYTSTEPTIGFDEQFQGPVLWFSSDRPGGTGKKDLWYSPLDTNFFCSCNLPTPGKKLGKLPKFKKPINPAHLNTPENDGTPFFFGPTQELFFSSDGRTGEGGYDIYFTKKENKTFGDPQNAGSGINTPYNDRYLHLTKDGKTGYLSSNRPPDENAEAGNEDIYKFTWLLKPSPTIKPTPPAAVPEEQTQQDSREQNKSAKIKEIEKKAETPAPAAEIKHQSVDIEAIKPVLVDQSVLAPFSGLSLFFEPDQPDQKTGSYNEIAHLFEKNYQINRKTALLKSTDKDKAGAAFDAFYNGVALENCRRFEALSRNLYRELEGGKVIELHVKGHTTADVPRAIALERNEMRVKVFRNYLDEVISGRLITHLQTGRLKLVNGGLEQHAITPGISEYVDVLQQNYLQLTEIKEK